MFPQGCNADLGLQIAKNKQLAVPNFDDCESTLCRDEDLAEQRKATLSDPSRPKGLEILPCCGYLDCVGRSRTLSKRPPSPPVVLRACHAGFAHGQGSLGPSSQCGRKGRDDDEDAAKRKPSRSAARSDLRREGAKPVRGAGACLSNSAQRRRGARHAGNSGPGARVDGRAEIRDRDLFFGGGAIAALLSSFLAYIGRTVAMEAPQRASLRQALLILAIAAIIGAARPS